METSTVLICSDSFKRMSGLSYVALNIAKYFFYKGYSVHYCIISGESCEYKDLLDKGHFFYECLTESSVVNCQNKNKTSHEDFNEIIKKIKPNIVFSIHDLWQFENIVYSEYRNTYTWVAYCPIESKFYSEYLVNPSYFNKNIRKSLTDICKDMDYAIPYNTVGYAQLSKLQANVTLPVPNGLDSYYLEDDEIDRYAVFKGTLHDDDFLFMTVGHNFNRKGLDYVVEAFYNFLLQIGDEKQKKKYKLYIHGFLDTIDAGTDIKSMIYHLKLSNNVLMSQTQQISKRDLYKRYRCADCYIGLPLAEGYGYGFMEAMINGVPVLYHNVGGIADYVKGISIDSIATMRPNNYYCEWKIPDIDDAVNKMIDIVDTLKNDLIDPSGVKQFNISKAKQYTWDKIYEQLDNILEFNSIGQKGIFNNLNIKRVI